MTWNIWRPSKWFGFVRHRTDKARRKTQRQSFRPQLEGLESRELMAFDATISTAVTANMTRSVNGSTVTYTANATNANVQASDIKTDLTNYTTVIVNNGSTGSENGNISWSSSSDLDFNTIGASKVLRVEADSGSTVGVFTLSSNIYDGTAGSDSLAVQVSVKGAVTLNNSITTGGANVTLTSTNSNITEASTGTISANLLTTSSVGGTSLGNANAVASFSASNSSSGSVSLTNTASPLTITGITQSVGSSVSVSNTGGITTTGTISTAANGAITLTGSSTLTIGASIAAGGTGVVTLTANGASSDIVVNGNVSSATGYLSLTSGRNTTIGSGSLTATATSYPNGTVFITAGGVIQETGSGVITANGIYIGSTGGTALTTSNAIAILIAANQGGGNLSITNTVAATIDSLVQTNSGDIIVNSTGALTVSSNGTVTAANGNISLTSGGTQILNKRVDADGTGNITITANGATSDITISDWVLTDTGNIAITAGRNITHNTSNNMTTTGSISFSAGGTISQTGSGFIYTPGLMTTTSVGGTSLPVAYVSSMSATNSGSGSIAITNAANLTLTGVSQSGGGNFTLNNYGNIVVSGAASVGGSGNATLATTLSSSDITLNATLSSASGNVTATSHRHVILNAGSLTAGGNATLTGSAGTINEASTGTISAALLTTSSLGGTSLGNTNTVASFSASNTTSGNIALTNTAATLSLAGVSQSGGGNLSVTNSGNIAVAVAASVAGSGTATLTASGTSKDITLNADVSSASGSVSMTASRHITQNDGNVATTGNITLTGTSGTITQAGSGTIGGALLTTTSATGTTLSNVNSFTSFNGSNTTSGNMWIADHAYPLHIDSIDQDSTGDVTIDVFGDVEWGIYPPTFNGGALNVNSHQGARAANYYVSLYDVVPSPRRFAPNGALTIDLWADAPHAGGTTVLGVDWGDGTSNYTFEVQPESTGNHLAPFHVYPNAGRYRVKVFLNDPFTWGNPNGVSISFGITVTNRPPRNPLTCSDCDSDGGSLDDFEFGSWGGDGGATSGDGGHGTREGIEVLPN